MSEKGEGDIIRVTKQIVGYMSAYRADCVIIAIDEEGYYSMQSNLGKSHVWVMLNQAQAKLKDQIEAQRSGENQNEGTGKE